MFWSLFNRKLKQRNRKVTLERLEDRIVLDAAIAATIDEQQQPMCSNFDVGVTGTNTVEESVEGQSAPTQAANLAVGPECDPLSQIFTGDLNHWFVTLH